MVEKYMHYNWRNSFLLSFFKYVWATSHIKWRLIKVVMWRRTVGSAHAETTRREPIRSHTRNTCTSQGYPNVSHGFTHFIHPPRVTRRTMQLAHFINMQICYYRENEPIRAIKLKFPISFSFDIPTYPLAEYLPKILTVSASHISAHTHIHVRLG